MSIIKSEVNILNRKDVGAEVKPVFGYRGFERFVYGYVAIGYGFSSEVFPRRGMAESFIKAFFRGDFRGGKVLGEPAVLDESFIKAFFREDKQ